MKEQVSLKEKTVSNLIWRLFERCGAQFVAFLVSIILARILSPEQFGIIALVMIVTSILEVFVDSGLGNALIQKKDAGDLEFSTVFFANLVFCISLYVILYITAPFIAVFYKDENLKNVIRVLGLTLIVSGLKNVQQAYVSKKLLFRKFFFATLTGTILAAFIGILLAYKGFGVWALVAQQLVNITIDTFVLWLIVPWRPKRIFSFGVLKELFSYGWKILVASLINRIYIDIRQMVVGRVYTPSDLAFYNQGEKFPRFISSNIDSSIDSVLFPILSEKQEDVNAVKSMTKRAIKISSYIMLPLLLGLAATSKNVVKIVLTDKWLPCVPYFILGCVSFALQPVISANLNAIKAVGRSDVFLKLEIIKKSLSTAIVFITMPFGVFAIAIGSTIYCIIAAFINSFPNNKLLNYSFIEQLFDIFPQIIVSVLMGIIVYFLPLGNLPVIVQLLIQVLVGGTFYILVTAIFKFESYLYIKNFVYSFFSKKINKRNSGENE